MRRAIGRLRAGGAFSPFALFAAGEQGAWYDPSDFSTMFQDSAGTTPVTATTQPVGKILDKSGRGNHATQATATSRPTLQQDASGFYYLSFDGVDDSLATAAINFTTTAQMTVWAGVSKQVENSNGTVFEIGNTSVAAEGEAYLRASSGGLANYQTLFYGTAADSATQTPAIAAPDSSVLSIAADLAGNFLSLRRNGALANTSSTTQTLGGTFKSSAINIGRRNNTDLPLNGRLYSLIVRGAASNATQITNAERFVGSRMGIQI